MSSSRLRNIIRIKVSNPFKYPESGPEWVIGSSRKPSNVEWAKSIIFMVTSSTSIVSSSDSFSELLSSSEVILTESNLWVFDDCLSLPS